MDNLLSSQEINQPQHRSMAMAKTECKRGKWKKSRMKNWCYLQLLKNYDML